MASQASLINNKKKEPHSHTHPKIMNMNTKMVITVMTALWCIFLTTGQLHPGDGILDSLRRQWTGKEFSSRF